MDERGGASEAQQLSSTHVEIAGEDKISLKLTLYLITCKFTQVMQTTCTTTNRHLPIAALSSKVVV